MRSGFLCSQFSTEADPISAGIRYLSAGDFSHVDLFVPRLFSLQHLQNELWKVPAGDLALLGARLDGGVQLRRIDYARFTRTYRAGCWVPDIDAAYDFAFAQLGKPYDKGAILDFFLHRFHKDRKFDSTTGQWFCDELNYEIYKAGGVRLLGTDCPVNLTPQEELLSPELIAVKQA